MLACSWWNRLYWTFLAEMDHWVYICSFWFCCMESLEDSVLYICCYLFCVDGWDKDVVNGVKKKKKLNEKKKKHT